MFRSATHVFLVLFFMWLTACTESGPNKWVDPYSQNGPDPEPEPDPDESNPDCCNSDSPLCYCFLSTGAWDPSSDLILDIAYETLNTRSSCFPTAGKPFYQMIHGLKSREDAQLFACTVEDLAPYFEIGLGEPTSWCTETVAFWHREAGIPYEGGFRNDWTLDWQQTGVNKHRLFYETEEAINGRGRWIHWSDLDYTNYQPGLNTPLPGSSVVARYCDISDGESSWGGNVHLMMIDEMTVYMTELGEVKQISVNLIEGNRADKVTNTRKFDDLLDRTIFAADFEPNTRRIVGFGVDLDEFGDPIFDESRLHTEIVPSGRTMPPQPEEPSYPPWENWYAPRVNELAQFATVMREKGGASITTSSEHIQFEGVPDKITNCWFFPPWVDQVEPSGLEIEIDLHSVHPLPVKQILLLWSGTELPQGYSLLFADDRHEYQNANVPDIGVDRMPFKEDYIAAIPVPVVLDLEGAMVRYIKLVFPKGSLSGVLALEEMRFEFAWGE